MAKKASDTQSAIAALLISARENQKLSLDDVAKDICVRRCFLEAIEAGNFSILPEQTFAVGFVRAYAKLLKLDVPCIVEEFKAEYLAHKGETLAATAHKEIAAQNNGAPASSSSLALHGVASDEKRWPAWLAPVFGLVGASASWMFLSAHMTSATLQTDITPNQVDTEVQQLAAVQARFSEADRSRDIRVALEEGETIYTNYIALSPNPEDEEEPGFEKPVAGSLFMSAANAEIQFDPKLHSEEITLQAFEDSWIQLTYADGSALWSGVLRTGQTYTPRLVGDVFLTTSNAGGVQISHVDGVTGPLGGRGAVVRELALNTARLSSNTPISVAHDNAASD